MKKEFPVIRSCMVSAHIASITLLAPEVTAICKPGQFAHIYCGGGVYSLTRRPISISKVVGGELGFLFQVKGEGTRWLAQRKAGDLVDAIVPLGDGCYTLPQSGSIIIAAGGIGYAPVIFLAQAAAAQGLAVQMALGARGKDSLYCLDEMEKLGIPVQIATEDGSVGEQGFVTAPLERMLQSAKPSAIYSCGPEPMLKAVAHMGKRYGVPVQVSMEERMACGVGACKGCVVSVKTADGTHYHNVCSDGPVFLGEEVFGDE